MRIYGAICIIKSYNFVAVFLTRVFGLGKTCILVFNSKNRTGEKIFFVFCMQTENLYFLLICAISENFEGKIGGLSQKMREIQNILEKKGWAYWFLDWMPVRWLIAEEGKSTSGWLFKSGMERVEKIVLFLADPPLVGPALDLHVSVCLCVFSVVWGQLTKLV